MRIADRFISGHEELIALNYVISALAFGVNHRDHIPLLCYSSC